MYLGHRYSFIYGWSVDNKFVEGSVLVYGGLSLVSCNIFMVFNFYLGQHIPYVNIFV